MRHTATSGRLVYYYMCYATWSLCLVLFDTLLNI